MSVWDTPEAASMSGGDFVSFKNPNTVVGKFLSIDFTGGSDFDGNECPLVLIEDDDGEVLKITCGQAGLRSAIHDARPEPGDRVAIGWHGDMKELKGGKEMKIFVVEVEAAEPKPKSLL